MTPIGITEIFFTLQGEGAHAGTAAVFVRLSGCNLRCGFCDTDFALREMLDIAAIVARVEALDPSGEAIIVMTGGEPLAQTAALELIEALRARGRRIHIESNGTIKVDLPDDVWLTVSPKARLNPAMAARANEAKLIVDGRVPDEWLPAFTNARTQIFLQPENNRAANVALAMDAVKREPRRFRLSLQTHKLIGIP